MPQYSYRGRDKEGRLRVGQRFSSNANNLGTELIKEGITPIKINLIVSKIPFTKRIRIWLQGYAAHLQELSIFSRQMQLLHQAGVPMVTALKQLSDNTRSFQLTAALKGVLNHLEKGENLATSMQYYPEAFTPLMISIVQIGETTGHLTEAFGHLHHYLEFELKSRKEFKTAFRYPIFVLISIAFAIVILNVFVIPSFSHFYGNLSVPLPWQTRLLIGISNFFVYYGIYLLLFLIGISYLFYRYIKTPRGKYRFNRFQLHVPVIGKLLKRINLIRFSESLSITLSSGISITQGLALVKNIITNAYIVEQIGEVQEAIERGISFTNATAKMDFFSPLEIQILAVGEKNGELSPSLDFIANFHTQEMSFELKKMNDIIGPIMMAAIGGLILIMALGIYLPIWNMVNLNH